LNALARAAALAVTLVLTTSCSLAGGEDDDRQARERVVLVTHDSFAMTDRLRRAFEKKSGYELEVLVVGNAGTLTNKLVLTKDDPIGDVAFGIDNTFGSRAIDGGVVAPFAARLPEGAARFRPGMTIIA
jgi:thiamine transport system substrate-binding protein